MRNAPLHRRHQDLQREGVTATPANLLSRVAKIRPLDESGRNGFISEKTTGYLEEIRLG